MKKAVYLFFLCVLGAVVLSGCGTTIQKEDKTAVKGLLDLHEQDFQGNEAYTLDGEWEFYWNEFINPSAFPLDSTSPVYMDTPGSWGTVKADGGALVNHGYATYHLKVTVPEEMQDEVAALYIPEVATAYTLWANGNVIAENGKIGKNRAQMEPEHQPQVAYFEPENTTVDLVFQVSEFYQRKSGWWDSFYLGRADTIQGMRDQNVAEEVFLVVSLLVMGLYHIGIFILRPKDRSTLYFGGVCLAVAARTLLLGEVLILGFVPWLPWELMLKFEYWSSCAAIVCFLLFIHTQYKEDMNVRMRNGFLILFGAISSVILVTPARIHTEGMVVLQVSSVLVILYLIYVLLTALRKHRRGARAHVIAMMILLAFVINDVLHYNHIVNTRETVSMGMFFYLFAQSFILSNMFTRALNQAQELSERLGKVNQTLELKVKKRTQKLSEANENLEFANTRLEKMHQTRRELMSNISHELGTPLTSIQGYIKGMLDGVVDRNQPRYLQLVYDKTLFLRQIIEDLRDLAKLESGGMVYNFEKRDIREFVHELFLTYKEEVESKDIAFTVEEDLPASSDWKMVVIDPIRLEQVVSNLVLNAKKFTPSGGNITLVLTTGEYKDSSVVTVAVRDDGAGINESELPSVFERFFKGRTNKIKQEQGVGLGLAISAEIIRAHGGEMGVDSKEGEGSLFYFSIPVADHNVSVKMDDS